VDRFTSLSKEEAATRERKLLTAQVNSDSLRAPRVCTVGSQSLRLNAFLISTQGVFPPVPAAQEEPRIRS
jgi:hypothetical protein